MSLTVVDRPGGHRTLPTAIAATVTDAATPDALVNKTTHGLSTGNYVYIVSGIEQYNGWWYVEVISGNTFKLRPYATGSFVQYVGTGYGISPYSITYYISGLNHAFNHVHLPMVYKIQSDLWPVNSADTARTVSSFADSSGYVELTLSGDIKATGSAFTLDEVIIDGTASLDGVYKIIRWVSDTDIVINLVYDATYSFAGGTVQYYYFNYHAKIRVYAGISSGLGKPVELIAEQGAIPDSSGLITFNVAEFVKKKISILENNLAYFGLPNNTDFFTVFYISVAESYSQSDGTTVSEYVSSYTDDSNRYALNSKEPFKTTSLLSDYLYGGSTDSWLNWLTNFEEPVLFPGNYFDVSFIRQNTSTTLIVRRDMYKDGVLVDSNDDAVTDYGIGLYRHSVSQSGFAEDEIQLTLYEGGVRISETLTIEVSEACENQALYLTWLNHLGGFDYWNFTARKTYSVDVNDSKTQDKNIFTNWPASYGQMADTIRQQTLRMSRKSIRVESQYTSLEQLDAIKWIVSSPLVQIVTSATDKRTVIIEPASLRVYKDQDKTFTIGFNIIYTDELPAQSL